jgi:hypothetical protein
MAGEREVMCMGCRNVVGGYHEESIGGKLGKERRKRLQLPDELKRKG